MKSLNIWEPFFKNNGYPTYLVNSCIKKYLANIYNSTTVNTIDNSKTVYCKFPYYGSISQKLAKEIQLLCKKYFSNINVILINVNTQTIGSYFNYKDSVPQ